MSDNTDGDSKQETGRLIEHNPLPARLVGPEAVAGRRWWTARRRTPFTALVLQALVMLASGCAGPEWILDPDFAARVAREKNRPMMLYFKTWDSSQHRNMRLQVFSDPAVRAEMTDVVNVELEFAFFPEQRRRYGVQRPQVCVMTDPQGRRAGTPIDVNSVPTPEAFLEWLRSAKQAAMPAPPTDAVDERRGLSPPSSSMGNPSALPNTARCRKTSVMSPPIALLITWTCYGNWLPGDRRGYVSNLRKPGGGWLPRINAPGLPFRADDPHTRRSARQLQKLPTVLLTAVEADEVVRSMLRAAEARAWRVIQGAVMANHVHVVVMECPNDGPAVRRILKGVSQAALNRLSRRPRRWWTAGGSDRYLNDAASIEAAVQYVDNQRGILARIVDGQIAVPRHPSPA